MKSLAKLCRSQWDRTAGLLFVLGGLISLSAAWVAVGKTILTFRQVPYLISGGLTGVCLVAVGSTLWISADIKDEWRKLDRLELLLAERRDDTEAHNPAATTCDITSLEQERSLRVSERLGS